MAGRADGPVRLPDEHGSVAGDRDRQHRHLALAAGREHAEGRPSAHPGRAAADAAAKADRYPADVAEDLWVDLATFRTRVRGLTRDEKSYINTRLAADDWGAA